MYDYLTLGHRILRSGDDHPDRTGIGRRSLFAQSLLFDLNDGFPLITTREIAFSSVVEELLWFIRGSTQVKELQEKNVRFWDHWAVKDHHIDSFIKQYILPMFNEQIDADTVYGTCKEKLQAYLGSIGPLYGQSWRQLAVSPMIQRLNGFLPDAILSAIAPDKRQTWENEHCDENILLMDYLRLRASSEVDQLQQLIQGLKDRPWSSRHVISAWIPEYLPIEDIAPAHNVLLGRGALAPCHVYQQYFVSPPRRVGERHRLSLHLTQRSSDFAIGLPVNIAQYALLLSLIAQCVDMEPYQFHWCGIDVHLYQNQINLMHTQLQRKPNPLPRIQLNPEIKDLYAFTADDIHLEGYTAHDGIRYPIAV